MKRAGKKKGAALPVVVPWKAGSARDGAPVMPVRYVVVGVVAILALASWVLWAWSFPNFGAGVDEAAYMLGAKGLATRMDPGYASPDPLVFMPETMIETRPGIYYPTYPIGFPLLAAAGYKVGGPEAAFAVNPLLMLAALVGVFFLARQFVDDLFALAVMFVMAAHPTVMHFGVAAMSHASDLAVSTWALYFVCAWRRHPAAYKLALAGLLAGYAVSIRYTQGLLILPLGFLVALRLWEAWRKQAGGPSVKRLLGHTGLAFVAAAAGLVPLIWYQWHAFGSPFTSSYAFTGQSHAFSWAFFVDHFPFAFKTLVSIPTGLFIWFPLGIAGLFVLGVAAPRLKKWGFLRDALFLALASIPVLLLYCSYYWVNRVEPIMYVRFFLTIFPVLIIAALMPVEAVTRRFRAWRYGVMALVVIIATLHLTQMQDEARIGGTAVEDLAAVRLVQKNLPADAVIVGDGYMTYALAYYTDLTVIYPMYFSESWVKERLTSVQGVPGQVTELNALRTAQMQATVGGRTQEELYAMLEQKLLDYAKAGRRVAMVTSADSKPWYNYLERSFTHRALARDEEERMVLYELKPR